MYKALYRAERPETFEEVIGQDHIVRILKNQVEKNQVGHAYLFCGTRGTGKTSVARILAKAVNCTGEGSKPCGECPSCQAIKAGNFMDVIEIDAASNNGIDSAREIRESVNYPPSMGKRKVYIIDEAHELTSQALNALLKTLEEPPDNIMFILATTDPQDLLQTILSRCLRLDFHRIPDDKLRDHMRQICHKRGIDITDDALDLLASNADGSARDALSLLDQCIAGASEVLDRETIIDYLGTASTEFFLKLTEAILNKDASSALIMLDEILREGKDVKQILADWMSHYRSLLIARYIDSPEDVLNMSKENVDRLVSQAKSIDSDEINRSIMTLAETVRDAKYSPQPRILVELAIVNLAEDEAPAIKREAKEKPAAKERPKAPEKVREVSAPKQEAPVKEEPKEKTIKPVSVEGWDLEDIWAKVWDVIDDLGSVTMVRINSTLAGLNDSEFKLLITSDMAALTAERKRETIEKAMSSIVGRPLKMVIKKVEQKQVESQGSLFDQIPDEVSEYEEPLEAEYRDEMDYQQNLAESFDLGDIEIKIED